MKDYWKVPFREVYSPTFGGMLRAALWCHVVVRVFPDVIDVATLPDFCLTDGRKFLEQHRSWFDRVSARRALSIRMEIPAP